MKKKDWVILGLAFLAAGFYCNLTALCAWVDNNHTILNIFGDVLPLKFSIGDCFLFVGYGVFATLLGRAAGIGVSWVVQKVKEGGK